MTQWTDTSSYNSGTVGRRREDGPHEFTADFGHVRLAVHRHKDHYGRWLATSYDGSVVEQLLTAIDIDEAKREATALLRARLAKVLAAIDAK